MNFQIFYSLLRIRMGVKTVKFLRKIELLNVLISNCHMIYSIFSINYLKLSYEDEIVNAIIVCISSKQTFFVNLGRLLNK